MLRRFCQYVSLNILGMLGLSCYILADTYFVSKGLGANGLAALNLAIPIYSFIHGSGLMIGVGGGTKYTIQKSQRDDHSANQTYTHALYLGALMALIFVLLGLFLADEIIALFGADEAVYAMAKTYLQVILLFAPAFILNNIILCFVRNDGNPTLAMIAMLAGSFSNVILDWVFIFPCGMGIFGAVFATGLAPIISLTVLSWHFIKHRQQFHPVKAPLQLKRWAGMIASGIPSLITEVSSGIVMIVFNMLLLKLAGNMAVAAYGVIANLSLVIMSVYTGIAQGIQPLMSMSYGQKQYRDIFMVLKYALCLTTLFSILVYVIIYFQADPLAAIFNSEHHASLQSIAVSGMKWYFIACPFVGINIVLSMYFTSTEKPLPAHLISFSRGIILIIPIAVILCQLYGLTGIWCAFPLTEAIVSIFSVGCYVVLRHQKKLS